MRAASTGPIPSSVSSSFALARFSEIGPVTFALARCGYTREVLPLLCGG